MIVLAMFMLSMLSSGHGRLTAVAFMQGSGHSVLLTWVDTQNPTGTTYNMYRASGLCLGSPAFSKIATGITALTYTDSPVPVGNFCYQATASQNGMESAPSNSASAAVLPFPPQTLNAKP